LHGEHPGGLESADDAFAAFIAERLKALRGRAGWSLEHLSKRAGVSRGMLSQIELARSVPTVTVLRRIASAFELPVESFFKHAGEHRVEVLPLGQSQLLRSADGQFSSRALFPLRGARRTEFYELTLAPGCDQASAAHAPGTQENLVAARGEVDVCIGDSVHKLNAGDAVTFVADVAHSYRNRGTETAIAYLVMTYPEPVSY